MNPNLSCLLNFIWLLSSVCTIDIFPGANGYSRRSILDGSGEGAGIQPRIVNGSRAVRDQYPFIVSLGFNASGVWRSFCGGSLYDRSHVITAAHCVEDIGPQDFELAFGKFSLNETEAGEATRNVQTIIIHSGYNPNTIENDMAMLVLENPIEFSASIKPICLTHHRPVTGEEAYVIGWGDTSGTADNNYLQAAMVPIISPEQCNHFNWLNDYLWPGMLCAGYEEGYKDSCQGDSGGPLVRKTGDTFQLIGVVSWGVACAQWRKPGVYADVHFYLDWVEEAAGGPPNYGSSFDLDCPVATTPGPTTTTPPPPPTTTSTTTTAMTEEVTENIPDRSGSKNTKNDSSLNILVLTLPVALFKNQLS